MATTKSSSTRSKCPVEGLGLPSRTRLSRTWQEINPHSPPRAPKSTNAFPWSGLEAVLTVDKSACQSSSTACLCPRIAPACQLEVRFRSWQQPCKSAEQLMTSPVSRPSGTQQQLPRYSTYPDMRFVQVVGGTGGGCQREIGQSRMMEQPDEISDEKVRVPGRFSRAPGQSAWWLAIE